MLRFVVSLTVTAAFGASRVGGLGRFGPIGQHLSGEAKVKVGWRIRGAAPLAACT